MTRVAVPLLLACLLGVAAAATFPSDMPTSFSINATVQGMYNYNEFGYYRMAAGLSTSNVNAFIQNPSEDPNALISVGLAIPGEFYLGGGYVGNGLVKVENPVGVAHFRNTSVRGAIWDDTQCGFGYYQYTDSQDGFSFTYYLEWMFWNIWEQQGLYLGNETVNGVTCYVYEVTGNGPMNFMMLWINTASPEVVQWTISYRDTYSYDSSGFTVNVIPNKFTSGSSSNPDVPERCSISVAHPSALLARKLDQQRSLLAKSSSGRKSSSFKTTVEKSMIKNAAKHAAKTLQYDVLDFADLVKNGRDLLAKLHREYAA